MDPFFGGSTQSALDERLRCELRIDDPLCTQAILCFSAGSSEDRWKQDRWRAIIEAIAESTPDFLLSVEQITSTMNESLRRCDELHVVMEDTVKNALRALTKERSVVPLQAIMENSSNMWTTTAQAMPLTAAGVSVLSPSNRSTAADWNHSLGSRRDDAPTALAPTTTSASELPLTSNGPESNREARSTSGWEFGGLLHLVARLGLGWLSSSHPVATTSTSEEELPMLPFDSSGYVVTATSRLLVRKVAAALASDLLRELQHHGRLRNPALREQGSVALDGADSTLGDLLTADGGAYLVSFRDIQEFLLTKMGGTTVLQEHLTAFVWFLKYQVPSISAVPFKVALNAPGTTPVFSGSELKAVKIALRHTCSAGDTITVTEMDRAAILERLAIEFLGSRVASLEQKAAYAYEDCKAKLNSGLKEGAMASLRRKKGFEQAADSLMKQMLKIEEARQLRDASCSTSIAVRSIEIAVASARSVTVPAKHVVSNTMAELQELQDNVQQIGAVLEKTANLPPFGAAQTTLEELETEYETMLHDMAAETEANLPPLPPVPKRPIEAAEKGPSTGVKAAISMQPSQVEPHQNEPHIRPRAPAQ